MKRINYKYIFNEVFSFLDSEHISMMITVSTYRKAKRLREKLVDLEIEEPIIISQRGQSVHIEKINAIMERG